MLRTCQHNQLPYPPAFAGVADSWFSAKDNITFMRQTLKKHFVVALKSNRTVALSDQQKRQGAFTRIDACELPEHQPVPGWIKGEAIYQKRWNAETFHKTLKSHAALAKRPYQNLMGNWNAESVN